MVHYYNIVSPGMELHNRQQYFELESKQQIKKKMLTTSEEKRKWVKEGKITRETQLQVMNELWQKQTSNQTSWLALATSPVSCKSADVDQWCLTALTRALKSLNCCSGSL